MAFLRPSSLRDTIGFVGDTFLHPVSYINPAETSVGIYLYEDLNNTSLHIGDYESLKEAAIDPYISIRNAYIQIEKRRSKNKKSEYFSEPLHSLSKPYRQNPCSN